VGFQLIGNGKPTISGSYRMKIDKIGTFQLSFIATIQSLEAIQTIQTAAEAR